MSWWNTGSIGNLANQAIKNAQKKIDKVLDIQGEEVEDGSSGGLPASATLSNSGTSPPVSPSVDTRKAEDEFWNTWGMAADKLSSLGARGRAKMGASGPGSGSVSALSKTGASSPPAAEDEAAAAASFSTDFFTSTLASSLSKVKSLQKKAESSGLLKKIPQISPAAVSPGNQEVDIAGEEKSAIDFSIPEKEDSPSDSTQESQSISMSLTKKSSPVSPSDKTPVTEPLKIEVPVVQSTVRSSTNLIEGLLSTKTTIDVTSTKTLETELSENVTDKSRSDKSDTISEPSVVPHNDTIESEKAIQSETGNVAQPGSDVEEDELLVDTEQTGWGDVSLSILTESQVSPGSSAVFDVTEAGTTSVDTAPCVIPGDASQEKPLENIPCETVDNNSCVVDSVTSIDSGNAWDIPELTESALVVDDPIDNVNLPVGSSDKDMPVEKSVEEESSEKTKSVFVQDEIDGSDYTSDQKLQESEVMDPVIESDIPGPSDQKTESQEKETDVSDGHTADQFPPEPSNITIVSDKPSHEVPDDEAVFKGMASLEGSTDTQEELSEENNTLMTDDFDQARLSSESSQATLELNPEGDNTLEISQSDLDTDKMDSSTETPKAQETLSTDNKNAEEGTKEMSSSGYVKNMLEEAMVESLKDNDSHTDSHSSSDMVRVESGPTSGHTSADEIETNTSSDIEIISHMSTPTPNGENRLFDLSPLRHAFSRTMRRNSPPGHKRSDSSSSGQSRNGDDALSPPHRPYQLELRDSGGKDKKKEGRKSEEQDTSSGALETEKLLKDPKPTPLQPIQENLEHITMATAHQEGNPHYNVANPVLSSNEMGSPRPVHSSVDMSSACQELKQLEKDYQDNHELAKKLAETAEVLDARERKLVEMSRENMDLVETSNILRQQLQQSEEAREAEMTDLNMVTEEFTKRMTEAEKKIQSVLREKEAMRKKLLDTEMELTKRANDKATERIMREKDQQIAELLEEGEKLSKQQLQVNNIIKKLRVKEKENESLLKSNKTKLDEQKKEIENLQTILDSKVENEKKQVDAINQLNNAVLVQEQEINRLKSDLEDSVEKIRSMQVALDNSYKQIGDLHKAKATRASEVQEAALSSEIKAREELQVALEHYKQQTKLDQEGLFTKIEDLQLNITRMEKENGRREDILKQEISDLQLRLQEAEDRNQELTHSVSQATRPLLRQIENLQSTYTAQTSSYEKVERNLTERLGEAQTQLAVAQEKERAANERVLEVDIKLSMLESQVSQLRQEKSRLQANLEMERAKLEILEDSKNNESAQLEALKHNYEHEVSELRKERVMIENQMEMEKMKTESEKKKVSMLHDQMREKELQFAQARKPAASPTPSFSRESSFSLDTPMNISQHEEALEKTLLLAAANAGKTTLYDSLRQHGATTIVESLQSQIKMREGEITQLQSDIQELERTRESMARELVNLTNKNEELELDVQELPQIQAKYQDLDQRYNAILQMYGEKVEEAEELRLDLQDIKDMYKQQINELLKNQ